MVQVHSMGSMYFMIGIPIFLSLLLLLRKNNKISISMESKSLSATPPSGMGVAFFSEHPIFPSDPSHKSTAKNEIKSLKKNPSPRVKWKQKWEYLKGGVCERER